MTDYFETELTTDGKTHPRVLGWYGADRELEIIGFEDCDNDGNMYMICLQPTHTGNRCVLLRMEYAPMKKEMFIKHKGKRIYMSEFTMSGIGLAILKMIANEYGYDSTSIDEHTSIVE